MVEGGRHPGRWAIVVTSGFLLALRFGFNFGTGNHNTYLLHAFRRVHPELWTSDWLATSTQDYHPVFTHLAALLLRLDESGWLFALVNVLCITASAVLVYLLIREVVKEESALWVYLLTVGFMGVGSTYSVSGSYLFSGTFQPSTVAVPGVLLALLWFVRERYLASGLCLAMAGAFHVNFAVLSVPLFGLAHLLLGTRGLVRRVVLQIAPVCVTLALLSPLLLDQAGSPHAQEARRIFQQVLAPQHYVPSTYWTEFVVYFAWCALGVMVGGKVLFAAAFRPLRALWLSTLGLVAVATLLTTVVFLPTVSQLYFWRLAPFTVLCSQIALCVGLERILSGQETPRSIGFRTLLFVSCAALIWLTFRYHYGEFRFLQYGLLVALAVACLVQAMLSRIVRAGSIRLAPWIMGGAWAVAALVPAASLSSHSSLLTGLPPSEGSLYAWARSSPVPSVFLIPPLLENFRLHTQRAVVVDFKSTPVEPGQLLEWYNRLGRVCGNPQVTGVYDVLTGYENLDSSRLAAIESLYRFDYVVVTGEQSFRGGEPWPVVFESISFRVYRQRHSAP